jgi:threonine/homoserine/homoserine lactone efflux protein
MFGEKKNLDKWFSKISGVIFMGLGLNVLAAKI